MGFVAGWSEWYVEDFFELANQLSWHDAALGACFQLGLDNETIRCNLPVCNYPLMMQIKLTPLQENPHTIPMAWTTFPAPNTPESAEAPQ